MTMLIAICLYFLLPIPSCGLDTNFSYIKTDGGVILCLKEKKSGNTQAAKIQIISNRISRVITSLQTPSATSGLIYDVSSGQTRNILSSSQGKPTLKAQFLKVSADLRTGAVTFLNFKKNYGIVRDNYESAQNFNIKEEIRITCTGKKQIVHLKEM